jgi:hypothetical protein
MYAMGSRVANRSTWANLYPGYSMISRDRAYFVAFIALGASVLGFAIWARVYGLGFGLPFIFDRDEQAFIVPAVKIADTGDLNPGWFGHPATTIIYAGAVINFVLSLLSGEDALASYYRDPTMPVYLHRLFCAAVGIVAVPITYLLAVAATPSRVAGLIAATFIAASPFHVDLSRIVRSDVVATTLITAAAYFAIRALESGRTRDYAIHGALVGLATMTKWPAVMVAATIVFAHFMRPEPIKDWHRLVVAGVASIGAAFVASPYAFLDFPTVWANLTAEAGLKNYGSAGTGFAGNLQYYLGSLGSGLGWAISVPFVAGVIFAAKNRSKPLWVLFLFGVVFLLSVSTLNSRYLRWALPTFPIIGAFFGCGLVQMVKLATQRLPYARYVGPAVSIVSATLIVAPLFSTAIRRVENATQSDTRIVSREWILKNIPAGSTILLEAFTPQLPVDMYRLGQWGRSKDRDKFMPAPTDSYRNFIPYSFAGEADVTGVIADGKPQYLIMSSSSYGRYDAPGYEQARQNVEAIFKLGDIIYEARPRKEASTGPLISIIKMPEPLAN